MGVTKLAGMFKFAETFNQPLDMWDTSAVTDMGDMFKSATAFNQPLDSWDTSAVTRMRSMFEFATEFNQPLDSWDINAVATWYDKGNRFYSSGMVGQNWLNTNKWS